jgi:hypothetical protein
MRTSPAILFLLSALGPGLAAPGCSPAESEPVIAQVGDVTLTMTQLHERVPEGTLQRATREEFTDYLHQWVRQELLFQAAEEMGYGTDARVERRVREARRSIMVDIFLEDELDLAPFLSDDEISAYYQSNIESFVRQEDEVNAALLWFGSRGDAARAREALTGGISLAEVASDTTYRAVAADLDLGFMTRRELGEELGDIVFDQRTGTLSEPVPIGDSFALIEVFDRQAAGQTRTLEEVRDEIIMRQTSNLWDMKLDELLTRLLEQADVSINAQAGYEALGRGRRR